MQNPLEQSNLKRLSSFSIASATLIGCGFFWESSQPSPILILLLLTNTMGVLLIYRLNDSMIQTLSLVDNIKVFFKSPFNRIISIVTGLVVFPLAFTFLSKLSISLLAITAILGILYTVKISFIGKGLRLKNVFLLKNILIGIGWGNLILIGSGTIQSPSLISLYTFVSVQVFIGSMIRDVADTSQDKSMSINSFPVIIGIPSTITFMHIINIATCITLIINDFNSSLSVLIIITTLWRAFNLYYLKQAIHSNFWSQSINLFTCVLIFLISIII